MGLWQVYILFSKGFTNSNILLLNIFRLVEFWILTSSRNLEVDGYSRIVKSICTGHVINIILTLCCVIMRIFPKVIFKFVVWSLHLLLTLLRLNKLIIKVASDIKKGEKIMISSKNAIFDLLCFIKDVQGKKIDIFIFYSVRYSQLLLFYFLEEASRNTFLNN